MNPDFLSPWLQFGIGGLMAGTLVWFLYWLNTKTIPKLQDNHISFCRELISKFSEELKAERSLCHEFHGMAHNDHRELLSALNANHAQAMERLNSIDHRMQMPGAKPAK